MITRVAGTAAGQVIPRWYKLPIGMLKAANSGSRGRCFWELTQAVFGPGGFWSKSANPVMFS
jgi:hypothetical protein